jgi:MarR family 2-MHQ and catechol resistance regulon transcriptional repressor
MAKRQDRFGGAALERDRFYDDLRLQYAKRYKEYEETSASMVLNLVQTYTAMESRIGHQALRHGLTLPGLNVLSILRHHQKVGCPLNRLSELLLVSRANITGLMDSLARKGYVRRCEHKDDRRVCLACITPAGEAVLESYFPHHFKEVSKILSVLSEKEKKTISKLMTKLRNYILQIPHSPKQN